MFLGFKIGGVIGGLIGLGIGYLIERMLSAGKQDSTQQEYSGGTTQSQATINQTLRKAFIEGLL